MTIQMGIFSCQPYDEASISKLAGGDVHLHCFPARLDENTVPLCGGLDAVCVFVNDTVNAVVLEKLKASGVSHIALRCAGYNNVDLEAAKRLGLAVSHVPAYAPEAVAEHAVALMLTLNRRMHKAYNRVKEGNFDLNGLLGFNMAGKTTGIIGTGHIGRVGHVIGDVGAFRRG